MTADYFYTFYGEHFAAYGHFYSFCKVESLMWNIYLQHIYTVPCYITVLLE